MERREKGRGRGRGRGKDTRGRETHLLFPLVPQQPQRPSEEPHSIETLLEVKDTCSISDTKWGYFCEKLRIKGNCSIHYIRRAREAAIKDLKPTKVSTKYNKWAVFLYICFG